MIKILSFIGVLFIQPFICKGQTDTIYYSDSFHRTPVDSAEYFGFIHFEKENWYKVERYFMKSKTLEMSGHYVNIDSETKEGQFIYYYKSGKISDSGNYHNNKRSGLWVSYYDTLGVIWASCNYIDGHKDGILTSYYKNGKLKRQEYHDFDSSQLSGKCHDKYKNRIECIGDIITKGACYDEEGKEIEFTRFEALPFPKYSYNDVLVKNIRYPDSARENNIEGRVIVKFSIEKDGTLTDIHVVNTVSRDIDAEAVRVVSMFKPWVPGYKDDQPAKVWFTLPIVFKLR